MADLAEWKRRASNGTSGDMVWDILSDWQSATDTAEALKPSHNSGITAAVEDALVQYTVALQFKRIGVVKWFVRAGNDRLNWLLKHQPTS